MTLQNDNCVPYTFFFITQGHSQRMFNTKSVSKVLPNARAHAPNGGRLSFETGKFAHLADGAVFARHGDTTILSTSVINPKLLEGKDFMPLSVEFRYIHEHNHCQHPLGLLCVLLCFGCESVRDPLLYRVLCTRLTLILHVLFPLLSQRENVCCKQNPQNMGSKRNGF